MFPLANSSRRTAATLIRKRLLLAQIVPAFRRKLANTACMARFSAPPEVTPTVSHSAEAHNFTQDEPHEPTEYEGRKSDLHHLLTASQSENVQRARDALLKHSVYDAVKTKGHLCTFMSAHVFAVYDFMSLAKRLQIVTTCVDLPWLPPKDASSARFINEIILAEESDVDAIGKPASHLEMYIQAMDEVGASHEQFDRFTHLLKEKKHKLEVALELSGAPKHVQEFVLNTLRTAQHATDAEVCSAFFYGREDLIPDMFQRLLEDGSAGNLSEAPLFTYYLKRHVELDGDEHGPAAQRLLRSMIDGDPRAQQLAANAAVEALEARIRLWDGVVESIRKRHS